MEYIEKAKTKLKDQFWSSPIEKKINQAITDDNYGVAMSLLQEIADDSHNSSNYTVIMEHLWKNIRSFQTKEWKRIYKALCLLEVILKFGPIRAVDSAQEYMSFIQNLCDFVYNDQGVEKGQGVRDKAFYLIDLLVHPEQLEEERSKAQKNRSKYQGFSSEDMGNMNRQYQGEYSIPARKEPKSESGWKAKLSQIKQGIADKTSETVQNLNEKYQDIKGKVNKKIYGKKGVQEFQNDSISNNQNWAERYGGYIEPSQAQDYKMEYGNKNNTVQQILQKEQQKQDKGNIIYLKQEQTKNKQKQQSELTQKIQLDPVDFLNFLEAPYQDPITIPQNQSFGSINQQQNFDIFNDPGQQVQKQSLDLFALQPQQTSQQQKYHQCSYQPSQNIDLFSFQTSSAQPTNQMIDLFENQQKTQANKQNVDLFEQFQFDNQKQMEDQQGYQKQQSQEDLDLFSDFVEAPSVSQQNISSQNFQYQQYEKKQECLPDLFSQLQNDTKDQQAQQLVQSNQIEDLFQTVQSQQKMQENKPMGSYWETHYQKQNPPVQQEQGQQSQELFNMFDNPLQSQQPIQQQFQFQQQPIQQQNEISLDLFDYNSSMNQQQTFKNQANPLKNSGQIGGIEMNGKKDLLESFEDFKI